MPDAANHLQRTVIHEELLPCDVILGELDMDWLRRQFSTLFDRAASAVSRAGYDLDDVVIDRFIVGRYGESETLDVLLPSTTNADAVKSAVARLLESSLLDSERPSMLRIVGLRFVVTLERWQANA